LIRLANVTGEAILATKALAKPPRAGCKGFIVGKLGEAAYPVT
jgi:hypothetical protein